MQESFSVKPNVAIKQTLSNYTPETKTFYSGLLKLESKGISPIHFDSVNYFIITL